MTIAMSKVQLTFDPARMVEKLLADSARLDRLNDLSRENRAAIAEGEAPLVAHDSIFSLLSEESQYRGRIMHIAPLVDTWFKAVGQTQELSPRVRGVCETLQQVPDKHSANGIAAALHMWQLRQEPAGR
jgi:hypothetical protein